MSRRLKIFTWHIHGSYLYYLSRGNYDLYIPLDKSMGDGYGGRGSFPFGENVIEVPVNEISRVEFDVMLFQSQKNYLEDQQLFSDAQKSLPRIYLEHDPPRGAPTETSHVVDDPDILLVHVTHFNRLMWNNNRTPSTVIEHGVSDHGHLYTGTKERGIVVINNIAKRGRRLGYDVFDEARSQVPLDLVGMGALEVGGLGEIPLSDLPEFTSEYRFFFNPIRYTSLGLAVCEAMMAGIPVVGLATTEMVTVVENNYSGFLDTDPHRLVEVMKDLLADRELAKRWGNNAREVALKRFSIERFTKEWESVFRAVVSGGKSVRDRSTINS